MTTAEDTVQEVFMVIVEGKVTLITEVAISEFEGRKTILTEFACWTSVVVYEVRLDD